MNHLYNLLFLTLLVINLAGLSVGGARLSGLPYGLAKVFTLLLGCLIFFFVEHYCGFRSLSWLMPVSTGFSLWLLWKKRAQWRDYAGGEIAFLAGFGYALLWRYFYPNIDASSEKLADLCYIASYLQGGTLPVPDLWLHPYQLTQYYSFQHYCAALLGRILSLSAGTAYNTGYAIVVGLVIAPAYEYTRLFLTSRGSRILVLAALLMGGTGACLFTPMLVKKETLFSSMRFIGAASADDDTELTPLGILFRQLLYGPGLMNQERREGILEMPMEIFSYVVQLGDYHAPLGGYVLLATAVAAFGVLLHQPKQKYALGVLLGLVPLCIAVNTWSFPFQALLTVFMLAFLWRYRGGLDWKVVLGSSLVSWMLLYPYFSYFLSRTIGAGMSVEQLHSGQHAPFLAYLIQLWPILLLVILAWFGPGPKVREYRWFAVWLIVFLIIMETFNINDLYGGRFERFNTTLKWWPWVAFLATLLLAPVNLAAARGRHIIRIGTATVLIGTLWYVVGQPGENGFSGLVGTWLRGDKAAKGQLDGAAYLRKADIDPMAPQNINAQQSIMNYLEAHPGGVLLECPESDQQAFIVTGALPLFTSHPTVFGWASHEQLWRGYQRDIEQRWHRSKEFFRGDAENPLEFLKQQQVRFIIWPGTKEVDEALFNKIKSQIGAEYSFVRFDEIHQRCGIWEKK